MIGKHLLGVGLAVGFAASTEAAMTTASPHVGDGVVLISSSRVMVKGSCRPGFWVGDFGECHPYAVGGVCPAGYHLGTGDISHVAERVKKIVVEHLGVEPDKVVDNARILKDLGADSLDAVELIMAFEEEFSLEIPDDKCEAFGTVGNAIKFLEDAVGRCLPDPGVQARACASNYHLLIGGGCSPN
jgi:acyl carrier protein